MKRGTIFQLSAGGRKRRNLKLWLTDEEFELLKDTGRAFGGGSSGDTGAARTIEAFAAECLWRSKSQQNTEPPKLTIQEAIDEGLTIKRKPNGAL